MSGHLKVPSHSLKIDQLHNSVNKSVGSNKSSYHLEDSSSTVTSCQLLRSKTEKSKFYSFGKIK